MTEGASGRHKVDQYSRFGAAIQNLTDSPGNNPNHSNAWAKIYFPGMIEPYTQKAPSPKLPGVSKNGMAGIPMKRQGAGLKTLQVTPDLNQEPKETIVVEESAQKITLVIHKRNSSFMQDFPYKANSQSFASRTGTTTILPTAFLRTW